MPLGIGVALAIPGGSGGHPSPENAFRGFSNVIWKAIFVSRRSRRRGGLRTPARKALASPRHVSVRPPGVRLRMGCEWNASAFVRPSHAGAETAPLRENRLGRHLLAFSVRPSHLGWSTPAKGRAPHARKGMPGLYLYLMPIRLPGHRSRSWWKCNALPFLPLDHAGAQSAPLREKSLSSGLRIFPAKLPVCAGPPPEGRAPHARKDALGFARARPR